MTTIQTFIQRHSVSIYFILIFLISWTGCVVVVGPTGLPLSWERFERLGAVLDMTALAGPVVASLLLTSLIDGRAGLRTLLARWRRWRVGARWYGLACLPALVMAAIGLAAAQLSPQFMPALFTADDQARMVLLSLAVGLLFGVGEEIGWTGFAVPRLRARHGVVTTGLLVGLVWGVWHFPLFWETDSFAAALPLGILLLRLFSWLPAFRVLMVWLYDRTGSLLVVMLMHASLVVAQLLLLPERLTGMALLASLLVLPATMWLLLAAVAGANHWQLSRQATSSASIGAPQLTPR
jgi:membrane protease YdiL (CAAX protease family)